MTDWKVYDGIELYEHDEKILAVKNGYLAEKLREKVYFMRWGEYIGQHLG